MNILHVVNIPFVIPYFLGKQLVFFSDKGYKEHIICSSSDELPVMAKKFHFEYGTVEILRKFSIWKDLKAVKNTFSYINSRQIDIVTGHTPKGALVAMLAAYTARVPKRIYFRHGLVYETSHGMKRKLLIAMDRLAAWMATKVVCVSPSVYKRSIEDRLNSTLKQIVLSKGTCNGIDVGRFCKDTLNAEKVCSLRKQYDIPCGCFVVGFTGRLVRDKGIVELVRAFRILQEKHSDVVMLLVGMYEERDALPSDVIEMIKNNSKIINTRYVPNAEIEYYYALMDVFVLPSYREGFPTSVLEASAMELPVVTTRETGCIDSIVEGKTGLFVEHDEREMASVIDFFYNNENMRRLLGSNGRRFVADNFKESIIWEEIEKLYTN